MNELSELNKLMERYPSLATAEKEILEARSILIRSLENGGKILICGNGGSASDSEHIVGELMKEFKKKRPVSAEDRRKLDQVDPEGFLSANLRGAFPAISLVSQTAIMTALLNDCDPSILYAQEVYGYGREGDVLIGMSTSGNAQNVYRAFQTARAIGIKTILITGENGGKTAPIADAAIRLPETETYRIQELTLPVYHALCILIEDHFYPDQERKL